MKKATTKTQLNWFITIIILLLIYWFSFQGINFSGIKDSAGQVLQAIIHGIVHPEWKYVYDGSGEDLVSLLIQTLAIAFLGTFISALLSVPFAFWAARSNHELAGHPRSNSGKIILTVVRTFPEIVLAIMFIKAVGPGSFAGVFAVSIHSIGMLGKLFSEAIENMDQRANEALVSVGGNSLQVLFLATLPTIMPEFLSYTLYRFEIAVRSASI
ncbi:ABC transporter permease subunit, partial [Lactobacillus sp. XV13L]|nr:ABC transporter permease subunit [Lactobacillus sp. XV13L]